MRVVRALAAAVVSCFVLAGCGSTGGGDARVPSGSFSLSGDVASFSAFAGAPTPPSKSLTLTLGDNDVGAVGVAYTNGETQPSWLDVDMKRTGSAYSIILSIRSTNLPPGQYSSTFAVGTTDANGNVLKSQDITVTYTVEQHMAAVAQDHSA